MISWLETTTAGVSKIDTFSSSASGTYLAGVNQTNSSTSSSSYSSSNNWSETFFSSTAYYRSYDGTNETVNTTKLENGSAVPNSGQATDTITATKNAQTSTTAEGTIYPTVTITAEQESLVWTTAVSQSKTVFSLTETMVGVTTTALGETTASEFGTTELEQTVYDVPWHNTIFRAKTELGEVLFSAATTDASAYDSATLATGVSGSRMTASFNTETSSYQGARSFATQTNPQVTASFQWSAPRSTQTTLTVCSFAFSIPQRTRATAFRSRTTTQSQQTFTYFDSGTVSPATTSTVWYLSHSKQTSFEFQATLEHLATRLASATRHVVTPHFLIPASDMSDGASRGVSITSHAATRALVTTRQDSTHASAGNPDAKALRAVYGPFGRLAGASLGAALSFPGIGTSFTVPSSKSFEAIAGREASSGTSGSVFVAMPGYYTYNPAFPAGSASLSISGDSFSFSTSSQSESETFSSTTSGIIQAYGPSFVTLKFGRETSSEAGATEAASLNLAGLNIIGGGIASGETAVECVPRGVWHNGSTTSFYDGAVTTRTSSAATTALVPRPYFFPQLAGQTNDGNNLIWATAAGDAVGVMPADATATPLPL